MFVLSFSIVTFFRGPKTTSLYWNGEYSIDCKLVSYKKRGDDRICLKKNGKSFYLFISTHPPSYKNYKKSFKKVKVNRPFSITFLMSRCLSISLYHHWYNFLEMIDVTGTSFTIHSSPKVHYAFEQLFFVFWLYIFSNMMLQLVPHHLDGIQSRTSSRCGPVTYMIVFNEPRRVFAWK